MDLTLPAMLRVRVNGTTFYTILADVGITYLWRCELLYRKAYLLLKSNCNSTTLLIETMTKSLEILQKFEIDRSMLHDNV